jgi:hypothetical protein
MGTAIHSSETMRRSNDITDRLDEITFGRHEITDDLNVTTLLRQEVTGDSSEASVGFYEA